MSTEQAIKLLGHKGAAAENPIEYIENVATKKIFSEFTKKVRKYCPDFPGFKCEGIKTYKYTDVTITCINGSIVAFRYL